MDILIERLNRKSVSLIGGLHLHMDRIILAWIVAMTLACVLRVGLSFSLPDLGWTALSSALPYILVILTPIGALLWAMKVFPPDSLFAQPQIRLARYGKWKEIDCLGASSHHLFGATGMMASLVLGMLINVPFRSAEFLMGIPALGAHPPDWFVTLFGLMTADLILMNSLYVVAFVMAIRHAPLFPRALILIWMIDLCSQLAIAELISASADLPASVGGALSDLLNGNIQKVLISVAVWLPYLLLSDRVNLTYRRRVRIS